MGDVYIRGVLGGGGVRVYVFKISV
jgi:hypothetical protein